MGKMTDKKYDILDYLSRCTGPASPTEIGEASGKPYRIASSWASPGLKSLVKDGAVVRYEGGFYEITPAGRSALEEHNGK